MNPNKFKKDSEKKNTKRNAGKNTVARLAKMKTGSDYTILSKDPNSDRNAGIDDK